MRKLGVVLLGGLATFNLACETVESEDVLTSGVFAGIEVTADGSGNSLVTTRLKVGGGNSNTFLDLSGDDKLEASSGDETLVMKKDKGLFNDIKYTAEFEGDAEDKAFAVAFLRTIDDGAPSSTVTLPAPFALTGPDEGTSFSRAEAITITWDNAGKADTMRVSASGDCIHVFSQDVDGDPGSFTIAAGSLDELDSEEPATCEINVSVRRVRSGSLDPAYGEGGSVTAEVVRARTLTSAP